MLQQYPKTLPNQLAPLSEKIGNGKEVTQWMRDSMDFFDFVASFQQRDKAKIYKYYQLFNGQYEFSDYEYVTKPFGEGYGELPGQIRHYAIVSPPIKALYGEQTNMPFNYFCRAEDDEAISDAIDNKTQLLVQFVTQSIAASKGINLDQNPNAINQVMSPDQIEEFQSTKWSHIKERYANAVLSDIKHKQNVKHKFDNGFLDLLICAREYYHICIRSGKVCLETINPLIYFGDKSMEVEYADQGEYAGLRPLMTSSQVIDNWGDELTSEQVDEIVNWNNGRESSKASAWLHKTGVDSIGATTYTTDFYPNSNPVVYINDADHDQSIEAYLRNQDYGYQWNRIPVTIAYWKSKKKIGYLHYFDDNDQEQIELVDETYKVQEEHSEWVEWQIVNEVWEGTKIGRDIYVNVRPVKYQLVSSADKYYECKLPITGVICNGKNSIPTSLLSEMLPYQELFNILMYDLEQDFNSEIGKVFLMSLRHIPKRKGWDEKKWLWYMKAMKIAWVDDSSENLKDGPSSFAHFQPMDLSLGNSIQYKVEQLEWIKQQCNYIAGTTEARLGDVSKIDTVGGTERSVMQSTNQTAIYFSLHNDLIQRVLTLLLNMAQVAYQEGTELVYFLDDMSQAFLKIEGPEFALAQLSVYVTNAAEDYRVINALRALGQPAMQNGADLSDVAELQTTTSIAKIKDILKKIKNERLAREQQAQKLEEQKIEQAKQIQQENQAWQSNENQLDRENQIQLAEIKAIGSADLGAGSIDANSDGIPDPIEYANLALEQSRHSYEVALGLKQHSLEKQKLALDEKKLTQEARIKKAEIAQRDRADKMKLRIAKAKPKPKPSK